MDATARDAEERGGCCRVQGTVGGHVERSEFLFDPLVHEGKQWLDAVERQGDAGHAEPSVPHGLRRLGTAARKDSVLSLGLAMSSGRDGYRLLPECVGP